MSLDLLGSRKKPTDFKKESQKLLEKH